MRKIHSILIATLIVFVTACQPTNVTTATVISTATEIFTPTVINVTEAATIQATVTPLPSATATPIPTSIFPTEPLSLQAYPRPKADNGLGIHWSTHLYAQSDAATSYFVSELVAMNIKWVKLLVDGTTNRDYDNTIDELVSRDIMPIIRIYQQCNTPYPADELADMVKHYVAKGVYYYDTYNEPNLPGEAGGWCQPGGDPQPEYLAEIWAEAAQVIYEAGGYPGIPSFFAPSQKRDGWQQDFFYRFFNAVREQGNEAVLYYAWASIHNYTVNHPPTYPYDAVNLTDRLLTPAEIARYKLTPSQVNAMNQARQTARQPGGFFLGDNLYDDSTNFFHFIAYRNQFVDLFGFEIPMISTEGGATKGSSEDPRYPPVDGQAVAEWTIWSADYMLAYAPDYYFATSTWLLAQAALDYNEPTWEVNAWYHNREGDYEPVVEMLKARPNLSAVRQVCNSGIDWNPSANPADNACHLTKQMNQQTAITASNSLTNNLHSANLKPRLSILADYPRPSFDNGRGVHGSPTNQPLSPEVVDYFINELKAMQITWFKFLQDDLPQVADPYLIEQLVAHDIEPIMRIYKPYNERYQHLPALVSEATQLGVNYFELYNEPNLAGFPGGWQDNEVISVGQIVELWLLAAREVKAAGGYPSLPPLAGGGTVDDMVFLRDFLAEVQARQQTDLFVGSWIAVHNYFLNHPLDYPTDPVNLHDIPLTMAEKTMRQLTDEQFEAINQARAIAKLPRDEGGFWVGNTIDEDSNTFGKFEAYANIFYSRFGYHIPILSTEGGLIVGGAEDPRYPPVDEADLVERTMLAYHFMIDTAPAYFFVQTPWLLANQAAEGQDERFEAAAWYKDRSGTTLKVVDALKGDDRRHEKRNSD